jgi:hypothetical protein
MRDLDRPDLFKHSVVEGGEKHSYPLFSIELQTTINTLHINTYSVSLHSTCSDSVISKQALICAWANRHK